MMQLCFRLIRGPRWLLECQTSSPLSNGPEGKEDYKGQAAFSHSGHSPALKGAFQWQESQGVASSGWKENKHWVNHFLSAIFPQRKTLPSVASTQIQTPWEKWLSINLISSTDSYTDSCTLAISMAVQSVVQDSYAQVLFFPYVTHSFSSFLTHFRSLWVAVPVFYLLWRSLAFSRVLLWSAVPQKTS